MSTRDRERFSRARRDLIDALDLWRKLSETPEADRDETLNELLVVAERSLADASEEYLEAGVALGYPRASASVRPNLRGGSADRAAVSDMKTEDLMALAFEIKPE